ncbi:MAG: RNA methyltransferase [Candidatus Lokiarchaeota archaeon]|nr:RNA methyltransferase [Candidatus Lokiarchaeota archaeon]
MRSIIIEGSMAVNAVLRSKYRKVLTVFYNTAKLQRKRNLNRIKNIKQILSKAEIKKIKIEGVDQDWFEQHAIGKTHGGIAALVSERSYQKLDELLKPKPLVIFFLDGIEDPFNLGYTIRSLYAAGIDGIVMKQRNWFEVDNIIIKSSAGTSELIPIALEEDQAKLLSFFKSRDYTIACADKSNGQSIYQSELKPPLLIVIGGEKRGIKSKILEHADLRLIIPYEGDFTESLPLHSAATIIAFEILRQRNNLHKSVIERNYRNI